MDEAKRHLEMRTLTREIDELTEIIETYEKEDGRLLTISAYKTMEYGWVDKVEADLTDTDTCTEIIFLLQDLVKKHRSRLFELMREEMDEPYN